MIAVRHHTRARARIVAGAAVLAACCLPVTACASDDDRGDGADAGSTATSVDEVVEPAGGPPLLPPLDDPALEGLVVQTVRSPEDITPEQVEMSGRYSPGQLVLYGDPSVADPFDRPWALAIRYQGSENSQLGEFSPGDLPLSYIDVPVEQTSQETLYAGVLSSGLGDSAQDLADRLVEVGGDAGTGSVEIERAALEGAPERLELITSGSLDIGQLNMAGLASDATPYVTWATQDQTSGVRRLSVASYAADPGLELLLRATMGGAWVGPQVLQVPWAGGETTSAVRTVGDTTVLVQSLVAAPAAPAPLEQLVGTLRPATEADWAALRNSFDRDRPRFMPEAEEYLTGDLPGGRWEIALDLDTGTADWGTYFSCNLGLSITFADGAFGGGGMGGGQCPERGTVGAQLIYETDLALLHGYLRTNIDRVVLTLDDGSVVEPELVGAGSEWRLFGTVVQGNRSIRTAEVFDADGTRIADLLHPDPAEVQEQFDRLAEYFESQAGD